MRIDHRLGGVLRVLGLLALLFSTGCLRLEVTRGGSVSFDPAGSPCPNSDPIEELGITTTCRFFGPVEAVVATASADAGYAFLGWEAGPAACTTEPTCVVPLDSGAMLRAVFARTTSPHETDSIHIGNDDVVYLYEAESDLIHRRSIVDGIHLDPIEVASGSLYVSYAPARHSFFVAYESGRITRIDLAGTLEEVDFASVDHRPLGVTAAERFVFVASENGYRARFSFFDASGQRLWYDDYGAVSPEYVWNPASHQLFFIGYQGDWDLFTFPVDLLTGARTHYTSDTPYRGEFEVHEPLRPSLDGTQILIGSGDFYDTETLEHVRSLPRNPVDAAWLETGLLTLVETPEGDTRIERWNDELRLQEHRFFEGAPLRVFAWSDGIVVLTEIDGRVVFRDYTPSDDTDADGVPNTEDRFPLDPMASLDSDGDGRPDRWNLDQWSWLEGFDQWPDFFPDDSACQDFDQGILKWVGGGGGFPIQYVCDIERQIPVYVPDAVVAGGDVVYVLSGENARIDRWSPADEAYWNPVFIGEGARAIAWSEANATLYVGYESGEITQIEPDAPYREMPFGATAGSVAALEEAGPWVFVADSYSIYRDRHAIFSPEGDLVSEAQGRYPALEFEWNGDLGRMYWVYGTTIYTDNIDPGTGVMHWYEPWKHTGEPLMPPLRMAPGNASLLIGPHHVADPAALELVGEKPVDFDDAAWRIDGYVTIESTPETGTHLKQWSYEDVLYAEALFEGAPLRLLEWSGGVVVVGLLEDHAVFHVHVPDDDVDDDGALNHLDAFPLDPAASVDDDGDGQPEAWNPGRDASDSTTGLVLDFFPEDVACWLEEHGRNGVCDPARKVPDFVPTKIVMDSDGIAHLLSSENDAVYRWSMDEKYYLDPLEVGDEPLDMAYMEGSHRLHLSYPTGEITKIELGGAGAEEPFVVLDAAQTIAAAGDFLFAYDTADVYSYLGRTFDADGAVADEGYARKSREYTFSPATNRLYHFRDEVYPNDLYWTAIDPDTGEIGPLAETPYHGDYDIRPPIRVSNDGSRVLLGSGDIYDGDTLTQLEHLPVLPEDALWLDDDLITLDETPEGDTDLEHLDASGAFYGLARFEGAPLRILRWNDRFLVVTEFEGKPAFYEYVPSDDADGDGSLNWDDDFPLDPAASIDSDGDGWPDAWNPGMGPEDSTAGLELDAFPGDSACQLADHAQEGAPEVCDIARAIPEYLPDRIVQDAADVLYLLSTENDRIYRWSISDGRHLNPVVVADAPQELAYSEENGALYLGYESGAITQIETDGALRETLFNATYAPVLGLRSAGPWIFAIDASGSRHTHYTFSPEGAPISMIDWKRHSESITWSPANARMYHFRDGISPNDLLFDDIDPDTGEIIRGSESPYHGDFDWRGPIRVERNGARLLIGSGDWFDATTLQHRGSLPDPISDALWTEDGLLTLRETEDGNTLLEEWSSEPRLYDRVPFAGQPLRVFEWNGGFAVVTLVDGKPVVQDYVPDDDSDGDGVLNPDDAFPLDPAASLDTDGDGWPDAWNPGAGPDDSTEELALDAFPEDAACQLPEHARDGMPDACDIARLFPAYEPDAMVIGSDDVVYLLSTDHRRIFRWSAVEQYHLDPIIIGEDAEYLAYSAESHRLYLGYGYGAINQIDLASGVREEPYLSVSGDLRALASVGSYVLVSVYEEDHWHHWNRTYSVAGEFVSELDVYDSARYVVWDDVNDRLYYYTSPDTYYRSTIHTHDIDPANGILQTYERNPSKVLGAGLWVAPDGASLLLGTGLRYDTEGFDALRPHPEWSDDAAYGDDLLMTLQRVGWTDTLLSHWSLDDRLFDRVEFEGYPLRVLRGSAGYVVVTRGDGQPSFYLHVPNDDTDADGVPNVDDAFPMDPSASVDSDADGWPDAWNPGAGPGDSSEGLVLDAFPLDAACQLPEHGFPSQPAVCDIAHGIPDYVPSKILLGEDDVLYLMSPEQERVLRWSLADDYHLDPIELGYDPRYLAYSSDNDSLYVAYGDRRITAIDPQAPFSESELVRLAGSPLGLSTAGPWIFAVDPEGFRDSHYTFSPEGELASAVDLSRYSSLYEWNRANGRIYFFRDGISSNEIHHEPIDPDTGAIGPVTEPGNNGLYPIRAPIRIKDDGSRVVIGSGVIYDAITLEYQDFLGFELADAAWLGDGLITIREDEGGNTYLEHWTGDLDLYDVAEFDGSPLRIVVWSGGIAVVTLIEGQPAVHAYVPSNDADGDGVANDLDHYILDPAASVDSDGDGWPDAWNPGWGPDDSTTGLTLDAFPDDSACQVADQSLPGDPSRCDIAGSIPVYVPSMALTDGQGVVYLLSPENSKIFRWSVADQAYLNPIVISSGASYIAYSSEHDRLYVGYEDGEITEVAAAAPAHERVFAQRTSSVYAMVATGPYLLAMGPRTHASYDVTGALIDAVEERDSSQSVVWSDLNQRVYHFNNSSDVRIQYREIDSATGMIGIQGHSPYGGRGSFPRRPPIFLSPDESTLLIGSGGLFDAVSVDFTGALPNPLVAAAWTQDALVTLRAWEGATRLEQWTEDFETYNVQDLDGEPLHVFAWRDSFTVVTLFAGELLFYDYVPNDDGDDDGVVNTDDDFPLDPAASVDSDGDDWPDVWNAGRDAGDSTTGLALDAFPLEFACQIPAHGGGGQCDFTQILPDSPEAPFCDTDAVPSPENSGFLEVGNVGDYEPLCGGWAFLSEEDFDRVVIRNVVNGRMGRIYDLPSRPGTLELDAENKYLYVTLPDSFMVAIIDLVTSEIGYARMLEAPVDLTLGNGGDLFISVGDEYSAEIYRLPGDGDSVDGGWTVTGIRIDYNHAADELIAGTIGRSPSTLARYAYDADAGLTLLQSRYAGGYGSQLAVSPDNQHLAFATAGGSSGTYTIFDFEPTDLDLVNGGWNTGSSPAGVAFGPQSQRVAASNREDMILFDIDGAVELGRYTAPECEYSSLGRTAFSRGGDLAYGLQTCGRYYYDEEERIHWMRAPATP